MNGRWSHVPEDEREYFTWRLLRQETEVARCTVRLENGKQCSNMADFISDDGRQTCKKHTP